TSERLTLTLRSTDVFKKEGEPVTLKCSYDSSSEYVYLHWYRQYPNRALQYLLYRGARSRSSYSNTADRRFDSSTELTLKEPRLSDTALYYCALREPSDTKSLRCFTKTHTPSVCFERKEIKVTSKPQYIICFYSLSETTKVKFLR
uniref:Ig-like domain-containing protein n=1 Tax=Pygocentrus nattereri TaxID=42514 RepID=A0AAR2L271_PYGNA